MKSVVVDENNKTLEDSNDRKLIKMKFFPLNEDKVFFILYVFMIYASGTMLSVSIAFSILVFLLMSTMLLNNVGHLMKKEDKEEK